MAPYTRGVRCTVCHEEFNKIPQLIPHLRYQHLVDISIQHKVFENEEEFKIWKADLEEKTTAEFSKHRGVLKYKSQSIWYYNCHRSGWSRSNPRFRLSKNIGTNKINGKCPAFIKKTVQEKGPEKIKVEYCDVHMGHDLEAGRLRMSESLKQSLAFKIKVGVPLNQIIEEERKHFSPNRRDGLITRNDLHNIARAYKIKDHKCLQPSTEPDTDLFENFLDEKESSILFYRAEDEPLIDHFYTEKSGFILGFMNNLQLDVLSKMGCKGLFLDTTHGTNQFDVQLTTLMIHDKKLQGFPVAFLFCRNQTTVIFNYFLKEIQKRFTEENVQFTPEFLMTADSTNFYSAWTSIFGSEAKHLIYLWDLKKAWNQMLIKVKNEDVRRQVKSDLLTMHNEMDPNVFHRLLEYHCRVWNENEATKEFGLHFETGYANRAESWALCYRKNCQVTCNTILNEWRSELNYPNFFENGHLKKLDKTIDSLMSILHRKAVNFGVSQLRCIVTPRMSGIRKRHKKSLSMNVEDVSELEWGQWLVPSTKTGRSAENVEFYNVNLTQDCVCDCELVCKPCFNICLHQFTCTCYDHLFRVQICEHIHLVVQKLGKNPRFEHGSTSNAHQEQTVDDVFHIATQQVLDKNEIAGLQKKRQVGLVLLQSLITEMNNLETDEDVDFINENVKQIFSGLKSIRQRRISQQISTD